MSKDDEFKTKISNYMQNIFNLKVYFVINSIFFFGCAIALYYLKNPYLGVFCVLTFYNFMYLTYTIKSNQNLIKTEFEKPLPENDKK
jgi:hypothetical protein